MAGQAAPTNKYTLIRGQQWREWLLRRSAAAYPNDTTVRYNVQYCGSTKWTAVAAWAATTAYVVGNLVRQLATPTVGFERVFRCISAGTSSGSEPLWSTPATAPAYGSAWNDGTVQWIEVTGQSAYGWAAAHARLANAMTGPWCAPGDRIYVSNNHAETQTTVMTLTAIGTAAKPNMVMCVNDAGSVPPVSADLRTTATVSTTGASSINCNGFVYCYGIGFSLGSGAVTANFNLGSVGAMFQWTFDTCSITFAATGSACRINLNSANNLFGGTVWKNVIVTFGAIAQGITSGVGKFSWLGGSVAGTAPTTLFPTSNNMFGLVAGVDLSGLGSGKNLVDATPSASWGMDFADCKLGSSVTVATGAIPSPIAFQVRLVNCDSADTNYRYYKQTYQGTITHETTVVRTGGASDGTTTVSRKMVSTANSLLYSPLESDPIVFWNESVSPTTVTVTIPILTTPVALNTDEVWIEVEYLGTSGFPLGVYSTCRVADVLAAGVAQPTDSTSVWTTTGVAGPLVQQSLTVTFTPTGKGPISVRVMLAKPSTTLYFDPEALATSARCYMTPTGMINEADDPAVGDVRSGVTYNRAGSTGTYVAGAGVSGARIFGGF